MKTLIGAQFRKEVRLLLPWWSAISFAIVVCTQLAYRGVGIVSREDFAGAAIITYAAGAVVLGALSLGHEFSSGTLAALLMQPTSRSRLLTAKLGVLVLMLGALVLVLSISLGARPWSGGLRALTIVWLPIAAALSLTPLLTMVTRGTLAGAVLSSALSVLLFPVGAYFGAPHTAIGPAIVVLSAISLSLTWWRFIRLEVPGGSQAEVDLLAWVHRPAVTTRHQKRSRAWLLVRKELRLQQVTFVASGLFVAVWVLTTVLRQVAPGLLPEWTMYVSGTVHGVLVPAMAGALASAEERRYGAADWHAQLPLAAWKQWLIKAGTVVAIAVGLAVGLPSLLMLIAPDPAMANRYPMSVVMAFGLAALYVSSLSTSGVSALLTTVPAVAAAVALARLVLLPLSLAVGPVMTPLANVLQPLIQLDREHFAWWFRSGTWWIGAGFLVLLAWCAFLNHRTADRSRRRVAAQVGWLAAYALGMLLAGQLVGAMLLVWRTTVLAR